MELEELIQTRIADVSSVRATKTFIALSTFKESAKIKLPDDV
jgi:Lrp/AsnC family leucine-responsive transcriptional regulator